MAFRALMAVSASICLQVAVIAPTALADSAPQIVHDGNKPVRLNGVWRSRGYGWLLTADYGHAHFFDEGAESCIIHEELVDDLDDLGEGIQFNNNRNVMRLPLGDASYVYTFDKIDSFPEKCHDKPGTGPISTLDSFIDIFSSHYAFFKTRNIDWPGAVETARKSIKADTSNEELLSILRTIISNFDDDHVSLEASIDDQEVVINTGAGKTQEAIVALAKTQKTDSDDMFDRWQNGVWQKGIGVTLLHGAGRTAANGKIRYGLIDGNIGYIAIRSMEEFIEDDSDDESGDLQTVDKALDDALALFKGAKSVIVDIAINDGGFDTVARRIAGRFAAKRTLGYSKYAGDSKGDRPQAIYVEPSRKRRFTGPVFLITSDITVSAAEILTMAMRALPNVTHIGGTTRGSLSDELWKPLPNGWTLSLSNEVYLDAAGKQWEGVGIPPQVPLEIFPKTDVTSGHLKAVRAVVEIARGAR